MNEITAKIENWSIITNDNQYTAPEAMRLKINGDCFNHKDYEDGDNITTSTIYKVEGDIVITKSGSRYLLGKVHPNYEKEFPNAKKRLAEINNNS